jgi:hypothetical protein
MSHYELAILGSPTEAERAALVRAIATAISG